MGRASRRNFLKSTATTACMLGLPGAGLSGVVEASFAAAQPFKAPPSSARGTTLSLKKGLVFDMLPDKLSYAERFKLAKDVGFDVVQAPTTPDERAAEELKVAADKAGVRIDSVMNMDHWKYPLSSSDSEIVKKSLEGMRTSLRNAKLWDSDVVLLVPGVVDAKTSYHDAWARSQKEIRKLIPLATELKVVIGIEEVWNKFLLSPVEMSRYIDEFQSPWIKAWFDVGNVLLYGYPQDWIRTLDKRIVKVHLKDFQRLEDGYKWKNLGEGDADWPAIRQAFIDTGYQGSVTAELEGGEEAYLRDVSHRIDQLLMGRG